MANFEEVVGNEEGGPRKLVDNQKKLIKRDASVKSTVVIIGDSITAQNANETSAYYRLRNNGYFTVANYIRNNQFKLLNNAGVGGNTTGQMLARFEDDVLAYSPSMCVILGGTNDLIAPVSAATILANLVTMYEACMQSGIMPILCTVPASTLFLDEDEWAELNSGIIEYAQVHSLPCANFASVLMDAGNTTFPHQVAGHLSDGTHPDTLGAKLMGEELESVLPNIKYKNLYPASNNLSKNIYPNTLLTNNGTSPYSVNLAEAIVNADATHTESIIDMGNHFVYQVETTNTGSSAAGILVYTTINSGFTPGQTISCGLDLSMLEGVNILKFTVEILFRDTNDYNNILYQLDSMYGDISPSIDDYVQLGGVLFPNVVIPADTGTIQMRIFVTGETFKIQLKHPRMMVVN